MSVRYAPGADPRLTPDEQRWVRFCIRWRYYDLLASWEASR